jgi:hypothetical protein
MTDDKLTEFIRTRIADDDAETLDTWLTGLQNWEQVVFMANAYEKSFTAAIEDRVRRRQRERQPPVHRRVRRRHRRHRERAHRSAARQHLCRVRVRPTTRGHRMTSLRYRIGHWLERRPWAREFVLREDIDSGEFVEYPVRVMLRVRAVNRINGHVVIRERRARSQAGMRPLRVHGLRDQRAVARHPPHQEDTP